MKKLKTFAACLALIGIGFYTLPVNTMGQAGNGCGEVCYDLCGLFDINPCQSIVCTTPEHPEGGETVACMGHFQNKQ